MRDFFPLFILFYCTPTRRVFASKGLVKTPAKGKDPKNKKKLFHQKKSKISQILSALFIALPSSLACALCIPGAAVCEGGISVVGLVLENFLPENAPSDYGTDSEVCSINNDWMLSDDHAH